MIAFEQNITCTVQGNMHECCIICRQLFIGDVVTWKRGGHNGYCVQKSGDLVLGRVTEVLGIDCNTVRILA